MTDTSPAALKAWALRKAKVSGDFARDGGLAGVSKDAIAAHAGEAALFRAVAALADAATGGDAQCEEDAAWCEGRHQSALSAARYFTGTADDETLRGLRAEAERYERLACYARAGGWRTMDGAPKTGDDYVAKECRRIAQEEAGKALPPWLRSAVESAKVERAAREAPPSPPALKRVEAWKQH